MSLQWVVPEKIHTPFMEEIENILLDRPFHTSNYNGFLQSVTLWTNLHLHASPLLWDILRHFSFPPEWQKFPPWGRYMYGSFLEQPNTTMTQNNYIQKGISRRIVSHASLRMLKFLASVM